MTGIRVALVTGGSVGIGRAVALRLGQSGYNIALNYCQSRTEAEETEEKINSGGSKCITYQADVSNFDQVRIMVEDIENDFKRLDVLVCNAGIYTRTDLENLTPEAWSRTIDVNLTGAFNCTHFVRPYLEQSGETGRIIFITSQLGFRGTEQGAHYSATKSGLTGFMKSTALSLAKFKVTVNAVSPGFVNTRLIAGDSEKKRRMREQQVPLGRVGRVEDIADAVAFLCSEGAGYITGETIHVNGGLLMY